MTSQFIKFTEPNEDLNLLLLAKIKSFKSDENKIQAVYSIISTALTDLGYTKKEDIDYLIDIIKKAKA